MPRFDEDFISLVEYKIFLKPELELKLKLKLQLFFSLEYNWN